MLSGTEKVARVLIGFGVKLDARDEREQTPLENAIQYGKSSTHIHSKLYISIRISLNIFSGGEKIVHALVEHGANASAKDKSGQTSLHLAVMRDNRESSFSVL